MLHKNRSSRRALRNKKIAKREKLLESLGMRSGRIYEKHREKIKRSSGYLSKHGTYGHYGNLSKRAVKTRDRNRYGKQVIWTYSDQQKIEHLLSELLDYERGNYDELYNKE